MMRRVLLLLAAIAALGALLSTPQVALTEAAAEPKSRVGAFDPDPGDRAGGRTSDLPAKRLVSTANSGEIASAYLVAARGGAGPVRAGQASEAAAGITKNTQRIPSALGPPGRYRIPDVYDPRTGVLGEVKNVGYQSYSSQLRDYAAIAQREGLTFELTVRQGTRLSGPLQQAEALGQVRILRGLP